MAGENGVLSVEALYSFKGKNNDELCFNKGDVITVTQREEGGWWEGTLSDKTGWFPSNYVRECKSPDECPASPRSDGEPGSPQHTQQQQVYRALVLRDILESERTHLSELTSLHATYLTALRQADILTEGDYKQLVGNIEDIIATHNKLSSALVEQEQRSAREQRIGGAFLTLAPHLQGAHHTYCSNHPRAVCILEKYKDELSNFMECRGVARPGVMFLTAGLSKPFRRLDRYAGMLHEYERHLEEGHPDRGDTQRSAHVYKELASSCTSIRRQKELELEVVTGRVHGWEGGESLGTLGDVVRMGSVALLPDHRDRYLVLFPATLVTLAVSPRMTAFIFQASHALNTIHVSRLDDTEHYKNAFEISGPGMERMVAVCQTRQDQQAWVDALILQCRSLARPPHHPLSSPPPPVPPAHSTSLVVRQGSFNDTPARPRRSPGGKVWSLSCLRPSPPLRPGLSPRDDKRALRHNKRKEDKWHEDDALILRVIEAYCTSARTRYTVNSTLLDSPQVLIAEEEKIIVEETRGNQVVVEEKSLVDTVYALKDQVAALVKDYQALKTAFESERQATRALRSALKLQGFKDDPWEPDATTA